MAVVGAGWRSVSYLVKARLMGHFEPVQEGKHAPTRLWAGLLGDPFGLRS